eukprot:GHVU01101825.1.p1 GENE.GHVU01101825.1~~GHVU01101825.1.p1  ORF type:complete len:298 (-),score=51.52 GHVU01101825.1:550-1443(-)
MARACDVAQLHSFVTVGDSSANDQKHMTNLYLRNKFNITIDSCCTIFHLWRDTESLQFVPLEQARREYRYRRPVYLGDDPQRAVDDPWSMLHYPSVDGEDASRADGDWQDTWYMRKGVGGAKEPQVLVDTKARSVPCVIHIHCRRNVDSMMKRLDFPLMNTDLLRHSWYLVYSGLAHKGITPFGYFFMFCFANIFLCGGLALLGLLPRLLRFGGWGAGGGDGWLQRNFGAIAATWGASALVIGLTVLYFQWQSRKALKGVMQRRIASKNEREEVQRQFAISDEETKRQREEKQRQRN